jgi:hypothetical protein
MRFAGCLDTDGSVLANGLVSIPVCKKAGLPSRDPPVPAQARQDMLLRDEGDVVNAILKD